MLFQEHDQNCTHKADLMAQNKTLREVKVSSQNTEKLVCRMTGETCDKILNGIASVMPFSSTTAVIDMEQKLDTKEYAQSMTTYLLKVKRVSNDVGSVIKKIFSDETLYHFNWDINLRDVFKQKRNLEFERGVRKAVGMSHHRLKQ
ncbi:PREDICTED: uncharacterized protein LOC108376141 [Rhagoletis zephyria]|uniref:uncharacterized protein LOC108376141 n=1 Tax=Rhagoletis zephyria TaxID=28612 RepID=UPI0008112A60|nr:PREDICTED: uncharacterized protein LOC108376141 [Rhagoletis zephyria]